MPVIVDAAAMHGHRPRMQRSDLKHYLSGRWHEDGPHWGPVSTRPVSAGMLVMHRHPQALEFRGAPNL
jgi:hypothetical protein